MAVTPAEFQEKLNKMMALPILDNLYCRWQDEKEYEDINDYKVAFAKAAKVNVVKATKRPFGFVVEFSELPGNQYHIIATARTSQWKRLK